MVRRIGVYSLGADVLLAEEPLAAPKRLSPSNFLAEACAKSDLGLALRGISPSVTRTGASWVWLSGTYFVTCLLR